MTQSLYNLFKAACKSNAERVAVIEDDGKKSSFLTYQSLEDSSVCLSQELSKLFLSKDKFVGVCMTQSVVYPVVILGILHNGKAFACVDPSWPKQKQLLFLRKLGISVVIFSERPKWNKYDYEENFFELPQDNCFYNFKIANRVIFILKLSLTLEDKVHLEKETFQLAYAVQTSGSTGQPKLIKVPHSSIVPNIVDLRRLCNISPKDVIFLSSPSTFDPSVIDLFVALTSGASLLVTGLGIKATPSLLSKVLFSSKDHPGVSFLQMTPSVFTRWSEDHIRNVVLCSNSSLRVLIFGGETCPGLSRLYRWKSSENKTNIFNIYGITEVSAWASIHRIDFEEEMDICNPVKTKVELGLELSETIFKIIDVDSSKQIDKGKGELYIGSSSRVCLIDDEKFSDLENPVFRATGDIVERLSEEGPLHYLGRRDRIVKRWGHRVCLEAIEALALTHKDLKGARCVYDEETNSLYLVVIPIISETKISSSLRQFLLLKINNAAYSPDNIYVLDHFPLSTHGKYDDKALLVFCKTFKNVRSVLNFEEKVKTIRERLSNLWCSVLGLNVPEKSFLQSGGNSILAVSLLNACWEEFNLVPEDLVTFLLSDCTFEQCSMLLTSYHQKIGASAEVENSNREIENKMEDTFIKTREHSGALNFSIENCDNENIHIKNYNLGSICSSSCRGNFYTFRSNGIEYGTALNSQKLNLKGSKLTIKWSVDLKKCVDSSPLCLIYESGLALIAVGSHSGKFVVVDGRNGEIKSSFSLPDRIESTACCSLDGRFIFVGCYDFCLYCLDISTECVRWVFKTSGMIKSSPALSKDGACIIFGSYDQTVYCLDAKNGDLQWTYRPTTDRGGSWLSSPLLIDNAVIMCSLAGHVAALRTDNGDLIWSRQLQNPIFSSPAILHCKPPAFICSEVTGILHCFASSTGMKMWEIKIAGNIFSSLSSVNVEDKTLILFGCQDTYVYCLSVDELTVEIKWRVCLGSPVVATPFPFSVLKNNECNILSTNKCTDNCNFQSVLLRECVVANTTGEIFLLNLDAGEKVSELRLPSEVYSSPVSFNNFLYMGCRDNFLYCLEIT